MHCQVERSHEKDLEVCCYSSWMDAPPICEGKDGDIQCQKPFQKQRCPKRNPKDEYKAVEKGSEGGMQKIIPNRKNQERTLKNYKIESGAAEMSKIQIIRKSKQYKTIIL